MDAEFERVASSTRLTRYGGEAYAGAMLAAGMIDLCFEPVLEPYDVVALIPIIEQAGGIVSCLDGTCAETGGAILMAGSPRPHDDALRLLNG